MGSLSGGATSGNVSITGTCGTYNSCSFIIPGCQISGAANMGALFVVTGTGGGLKLSNLFLHIPGTGLVQGSQGENTTDKEGFNIQGSGPRGHGDKKTFFILFKHTKWNTGKG